MDNKPECRLHIHGKLATTPEVINGITFAVIYDSEPDLNNPDESEIFNGVVHQTIGACSIDIRSEKVVFVIDNIKLKPDFPKEDIQNIMSKYISGLDPDHIKLVTVVDPITEKRSNYDLVTTKVIYAISLDSEPGQIEFDKNPPGYVGLN